MIKNLFKSKKESRYNLRAAAKDLLEEIESINLAYSDSIPVYTIIPDRVSPEGYWLRKLDPVPKISGSNLRKGLSSTYEKVYNIRHYYDTLTTWSEIDNAWEELEEASRSLLGTLYSARKCAEVVLHPDVILYTRLNSISYPITSVMALLKQDVKAHSEKNIRKFDRDGNELGC